MKILNFGSLNIDHVYHVPHMIRPGETLSSYDLNHFAGGKGANQSVALAKAGLDVWHAGKIGRDGDWIIELLNQYGVHTEYIESYEGSSGHTIIQITPEGQNSIILHGGGNQSITPEEVDRTLSVFSKGDYLILQNEINLMPYILKAARNKGMVICLNPAPFDQRILKWPLEVVDLLVVNEIEARELSGIEGDDHEVLNGLTQEYPEMDILMTVGKEGSYFGKGQECIHVPIVDSPVVDTTAAGDTFFGYYLASRIMGMSVRNSMERATKASAITVSRPGAMDSIPLACELE